MPSIYPTPTEYEVLIATEGNRDHKTNFPRSVNGRINSASKQVFCQFKNRSSWSLIY